MTIDILDGTGKNIRCRNCTLEINRYATNGNLAIQAYRPDGEPFGVMTVNPQEKLDDAHVCVKDYSEGEGNLMTLMAAGLVGEPERMIDSGWVRIPVCPLTEKGLAWVKAELDRRSEEPEDAEDGNG